MSDESGHISPFHKRPAIPEPYRPAQNTDGRAGTQEAANDTFSAALAAAEPAPATDGNDPAEKPATTDPSRTETERRFFRAASSEVGDDYFARPRSHTDLQLADERTHGAGKEIGFDDLIDLINPLHHLPLVGDLYRSITGDEISGPAKVLGGFLYGGPVGFMASAMTSIVEESSGQGVAETVIAGLFGGSDSAPGEALAAQQTAPPEVPLATAAPPPAAADDKQRPADPVDPADIPPEEEADGLTGAAALSAFMSDLRSVGQQAARDNPAAAAAQAPTAPVADGPPRKAADDLASQDQTAHQGYSLADYRRSESPARILSQGKTAPSLPAVPAGPGANLAADMALLTQGAASAEIGLPGGAPGTMPGGLPAPGQSFADQMMQALDKYAAMGGDRPGAIGR